jgi:hypothetical protein
MKNQNLLKPANEIFGYISRPDTELVYGYGQNYQACHISFNVITGIYNVTCHPMYIRHILGLEPNKLTHIRFRNHVELINFLQSKLKCDELKPVFI